MRLSYLERQERAAARERYKTEGDLCDAFQRALEAWCDKRRPGRWTVYPEVEGWDLVIVRDDGEQFGVEAKLRASLDVVCNVLKGRQRMRRPRWAGVLVPVRTHALERVCVALGVHLVSGRDIQWLEDNCSHAVAGVPPDGITVHEGERWDVGGEPLELPEIPQQTGGGRPCPRTLSSWRVAALKLCLLLEEQGGLSSQDFRDAGVNIQRWRDALWIKREGDDATRWTERADGKPGRWAWYVEGPYLKSKGPAVGYEAELEVLRGQR